MTPSLSFPCLFLGKISDTNGEWRVSSINHQHDHHDINSTAWRNCQNYSSPRKPKLRHRLRFPLPLYFPSKITIINHHHHLDLTHEQPFHVFLLHWRRHFVHSEPPQPSSIDPLVPRTQRPLRSMCFSLSTEHVRLGNSSSVWPCLRLQNLPTSSFAKLAHLSASVTSGSSTTPVPATSMRRRRRRWCRGWRWRRRFWRRWTIHPFCVFPTLHAGFEASHLRWIVMEFGGGEGCNVWNCFVCWENYERVKKSCLVTGKVTVVWLVEFI